MSRTMTTINDLRAWVAESLSGTEYTDADMGRIARRLANDRNSPRWGADWSEYLDRLTVADLDELAAA